MVSSSKTMKMNLRLRAVVRFTRINPCPVPRTVLGTYSVLSKWKCKVLFHTGSPEGKQTTVVNDGALRKVSGSCEQTGEGRVPPEDFWGGLLGKRRYLIGA